MTNKRHEDMTNKIIHELTNGMIFAKLSVFYVAQNKLKHIYAFLKTLRLFSLISQTLQLKTKLKHIQVIFLDVL